MRVAELVLDYVKVLVWPGVVVLALCLFRLRLQELLARLTSFEGPGGVKAAFTEGLAQVQERLQQTETGQTPQDRTGAAPSPGAENEISEWLAEVDDMRRSTLAYLEKVRTRSVKAGATAPALALAWDRLEDFFRQLATALVRRGMPLADTPIDTVVRSFGGDDLKASVQDLRRLKDQTLYRFEFITEVQADDFVRTVENVVRLTSSLATSRIPAPIETGKTQNDQAAST
ncbi:hypothetical protein LY71_1183 [Geodermatophilus tzadiensis]|uniref:Uncharacterized protein n=1 Tax=Geodermatophilus tzadiensis TaxID=1137988 RepID=A0A2T0T8T6_9ACTN|nr:hypothetical protein [Geodermatophilus tzadiensis]PRY42056.1 hypothetical protein LY71_1183 [Geodermatophilus tzadiensis]